MTNFDLDTPILYFGYGSPPWTIRNAVEGVQIFGGIGSGKTSGSGLMLAMKYLQNGFGGLVLAVKAEEKDMWVEYCNVTGRTNDLIVVEPGKANYFNFLEYESSQSGEENSFTANLVDVLDTVIGAGAKKSGGTEDGNFWESALKLLVSNTIDLCLLAYRKVSVQMLYAIVVTAPKPSATQTTASATETFFFQSFEKARGNVMAKIDEWKKNFSPEFLQQLQQNGDFETKLNDDVPDARTISFVDQFFMETYKDLSEKTRSIVEFLFTTFLYGLLQNPIYSLFCQHPSTFTPEDCLRGKIILLNLPVKRFGKVGRDCQILFKYIWQRAMERRDVRENELPVFLWADEAQHFLHEHDAVYQATARSSRIATVYLTQNLPNYHANLGGDRAEYRVKGFLGTLATKIFHANADIDTNEYASKLIGEGYTKDVSRTTTQAGQFSTAKSVSFSLEKMVRPESFMLLKSGGPGNKFLVHAYMVVQGLLLGGEVNFKKVSFNQYFKPNI